ncbi:MAG TPA: hypothetical protein VM049_11135 [Gaiellaceae bacterium]|nr:hypothetical protein [Gaiellaceae bacterium]
MRKTIFAIAALVALAASSVAVAHLKSANVSPVNATLSAPTTAHLTTRTVTCDGQTVEISNGRYTGTSASTTADLAGTVELRVQSVYNTTTKLGWVDGSLKIRAADNRSSAQFAAINSDGKLDGWLRGNAGRGDGAFFGSLSGSFSKTGGLTNGQFGTGAGANAAVLLKRAECKASETVRPSVRLTVRGTVESISATEIKVKPADGTASQTCAIGDRKPERIEAGDKVEITCLQRDGKFVLEKIHERG